MIEIYFVYVRILNEDKVKILNENYGYILWKLIGCWYKIKKRIKIYFVIKFMIKKNLKIVDVLFCIEILNFIKKMNSLISWNILVFIFILNILFLCIFFSVYLFLILNILFKKNMFLLI